MTTTTLRSKRLLLSDYMMNDVVADAFCAPHWHRKTGKRQIARRPGYGFGAARQPQAMLSILACGFDDIREMASYLAAYGPSPHCAQTGKQCRVMDLGDAANGILGCRRYIATVIGSSSSSSKQQGAQEPMATSAIPFTSLGDALTTESTAVCKKFIVCVDALVS
jgi:hypothetical protein